jgi:ectoine hydroxylase-related dioxygenase (phytanoyl-CoA dioxygenase family)
MKYNIQEQIANEGFAIVDAIFSATEIEGLLHTLSQSDTEGPSFRKTSDLFAIRQFFKEIPDAIPIIFNAKLVSLITSIFGTDYFVVKSIYFDKPATSNWFVAYHQDLTISVDKKMNIAGFGPWTIKQNQYAVQPPLPILEDNFTIRIHLDDANAENGALKVLPKSHLKGICRPETIDWNTVTTTICNVKKGSVMLMKPLLLHASGKTTNAVRRRVLHIEFSRTLLPETLRWSEFLGTDAYLTK